MIKYNLRTFASVLLGLAFVTYIILFVCSQDLKNINFHKALTDISTTISINIGIWTIFVFWGWKLRIFYPWLVPFPDLSGKWDGEIISSWNEKRDEPIPITLTIDQNFFNTQIQIKTGESKSYSVSSNFDIDKERGLEKLVYTYLNVPKSTVRDRSQIHYGSAILEFTGFNVTEMEGEYWTDRKTIGSISVQKQNK
ncbi:MAG: hypothetical protein MUW56_06760 [Chryseobacterium sp.]|uniref:Cap15 family cyclic dinucleotide receptor domain-containing protein n=1 Tax=Chryseobacterium sp. TaxID=1871047 RepID=UPI0025C68CAB|nr:hypothetical protein [Chryseobacterium sp.]MCJ7933333.1 hypothetical protein [Chryseobacterium sp.]